MRGRGDAKEPVMLSNGTVGERKGRSSGKGVLRRAGGGFLGDCSKCGFFFSLPVYSFHYLGSVWLRVDNRDEGAKTHGDEVELAGWFLGCYLWLLLVVRGKGMEER